MYKKISSFLQRLGKQVSEFGKWSAAKSKNKHDITKPTEQYASSSIQFRANKPKFPDDSLVDEPPLVPLSANDSYAIWLGSADYRAHEFFSTTKVQLSSLPNLHKMSCADIAFALNKAATVYPRDTNWNSRLVYHFTRHYTNFRPRF
jgi:hypothetical protein